MGIQSTSGGHGSGLSTDLVATTSADSSTILAQTVQNNWQLTDKEILAALSTVPRERFVPTELREDALKDQCVTMPGGYSVSQPGLVARMIEYLELKPDSVVLDVGAGSGYHAALMSRLAAMVYGIERLPHAAARAQAVLQELEIQNVDILVGDGFEGRPDKASFDAINVACAVSKIPLPLINQLKVGGRMILPYGPNGVDPATDPQKLVLVEKLREGFAQRGIIYSPFLRITELFPVQFMLMTSDSAEAKGSGLDSLGGKV